MELSKSKDKIYCQIRKEWIQATPEEKIRQGVLQHLILDLRYPASHIVVEMGLHQMPHLSLSQQKFPLRRADIVCFGKGVHPNQDLYPLLLIECKAIKLTQKMVRQAIGYNHFLKAYYIAVLNDREVLTGWWNPSTKDYQFVSRLPSYADLLESVQK